MLKRLAIYYRVSTDRQDLESQKHEIKRYLENLPQNQYPTSMVEYTDIGISGSSKKRPGFEAMLEAAFAGQLDNILVYRLDRFSRRASVAIQLILSLDEAGVGFVSATQPVLNLGSSNPFRRTLLAAFAEIAEIERSTLIARVRSGMEAARARGVKFGAPKKVDEAMVRAVLTQRTAGLSIRTIAKKLGLSVGSVASVVSSHQGQVTRQNPDGCSQAHHTKGKDDETMDQHSHIVPGHEFGPGS